MTQLYLIRHGEALSAIQGRVGDAGLSPLGVAQARRLRDRLAATREIAADVLIASTYLRAQQTAQIIAPALGLPLLFDETLQELRPVEAECMAVDEFRQKFAPAVTTVPFSPSVSNVSGKSPDPTVTIIPTILFSSSVSNISRKSLVPSVTIVPIRSVLRL